MRMSLQYMLEKSQTALFKCYDFGGGGGGGGAKLY